MADAKTDNHAQLMDGVYRSQRHFYDLTRKYYLLGRDLALESMAPAPGQSVLEIGCGTGRNLALAAKLFPAARLFGFDISSEMLKSADEKMAKSGITDRVRLAQADATNFDPQALFNEAGFDRILISYAVSMIPVWDDAIRHAATQLKPGGKLHVIDFGQQANLPKWFRSGLHAWLAKFHVEPRANLKQVLDEAAQAISGTAKLESLYRDYAWHGIVQRPA
ncbi:MAG: methyltransferase domain-containing protein [Pseudomonadota bacterium]